MNAETNLGVERSLTQCHLVFQDPGSGGCGASLQACHAAIRGGISLGILDPSYTPKVGSKTDFAGLEARSTAEAQDFKN